MHNDYSPKLLRPQHVSSLRNRGRDCVPIKDGQTRSPPQSFRDAFGSLHIQELRLLLFQSPFMN